jgi:hypothetical protein
MDPLNSIVPKMIAQHLAVFADAKPDLALGSGLHRGSWRLMWEEGPDNWPEKAFGPHRIDLSGFFALRSIPPGMLFAEPVSPDVLGLYPAQS